MKNIVHKKWTWILGLTGFIFLGAQLLRPKMDNPPVEVEITVPDSIKSILQKACYDCHSNETKLAWFDKITPVNWVVASDIRKGRKAFNFSEWNNFSKDRQKGILFESLNHIHFGIMPLRQYIFLHPGAKIDEKEINVLESYLSTLMMIPVPDTMKISAWNVQYSKWIKGVNISKNVKPSPNGISFMADYKDWTAISSTERLDDGRMRLIMGNDIAVNAIKANHINPWPDGTAFAKIAWTMVADSSENIYTGEFKQVAFMIKDKTKYSSTEGWGFAQWENGIELVPHGENVTYTTGCVNCHKPMKDNDFVFTMPLDPAKEHALEDKVICSFINKKEGTMSILLGNKIAVGFARSNTGSNYPPGAALTLVTWNRKKDEHWFGAYIPDVMQSMEKLRFDGMGKSVYSPAYEVYRGNSLKKIDSYDLKDVKERTNYILSLRASVMP